MRPARRRTPGSLPRAPRRSSSAVAGGYTSRSCAATAGPSKPRPGVKRPPCSARRRSARVWLAWMKQTRSRFTSERTLLTCSGWSAWARSRPRRRGSWPSSFPRLPRHKRSAPKLPYRRRGAWTQCRRTWPRRIVMASSASTRGRPAKPGPCGGASSPSAALRGEPSRASRTSSRSSARALAGERSRAPARSAPAWRRRTHLRTRRTRTSRPWSRPRRTGRARSTSRRGRAARATRRSSAWRRSHCCSRRSTSGTGERKRSTSPRASRRAPRPTRGASRCGPCGGTA